MNVKKQQMQLPLQQPQRGHSIRTAGFETLLDRSTEETSSWSPVADHRRHARQQQQQHHHRRDSTAESGGNATPPTEPADTGPRQPQPPTSPLSLPSPYYDRNPVIGFPLLMHHHRHHHAAKTPPPTTTPLANAQQQNNVGPEPVQEIIDYCCATNDSKYYHHHHHHHNYDKSNSLTDGRDENKENVKQLLDAECLQQQLDEVLKACVDYEERNKSGQKQSASTESSENASSSPGGCSAAPQQNRIKTNGSLPRESNKTGTGTSSSPTSPLSPLSPTSPSSLMTWPTTASSPSSVALSPLSPHATAGTAVNGGGDSVFLENDAIQRSSSAPPPQNANICGSPRSRIRTLVPSSSPMTAATATDLYYASNKDRDLWQRLRHNGTDDVGLKRSPGNPLFSAKSPPDRQQNSPLQSTLLHSPSSQPSWQSTTTWLRSSPFAVDSAADGVDSSGGGATEKAVEAAERRRKLLVELSGHKSRLVELHLRREEVDRELIIETALLRAELDAADDETRQSDNIVDGLDRAVTECRQQMDACTVKQQEQRTAADVQLAGHRRALNGLRNRLESVEDDDRLKTEIRASIDKQTELLEAEQKLYEDVEFGLLEEEAGWLARREELHRDRAAAVAVRRARRARAEWLRAQLDQLRSVGDDQLRALRADINTATLSIQQGHRKLQDLDAAVAGTTVANKQQRLQQQCPYENSEQPKSLQEWSWDHRQLRSKSPPRSLSWMDHQQQQQFPGSPLSPAATSAVNGAAAAAAGYQSPTMIAEPVANNNLMMMMMMTNSMTTTCCSSVASSIGGEDDICRPVSEESMSRMSMSTIFDGGAAEIKLRCKNKSSPSDITKRPLTRYLPIRYDGGDDAAENPMAFDLRAHIESAGHQLDDDDDDGGGGGGRDRHFWIDSTSCRGYLKKLSGAGDGKNNNTRRGVGGGGGRSKWLKRWFVFDRRSRTLSYYHRRSDDHVTTTAGTPAAKKTGRHGPRASIRFQDIQEVYVDHTNSSKGHGCAFVVKTAQRTFHLSAATGQAVRVWVDVVFTGAEGYREYLKVDDTGNNRQRTKS